MLEERNKKSTLTVDENDILLFAERIKQNNREDNLFSQKLDNFINNREKNNEPLVLCHTPNCLAISGAKSDLDVVINPKTIVKCMSDRDIKYHGHGLSAEIMKQLPTELRNPAMLFKGSKDNSLVAITELKDKGNREIMIAVSLSDKKGFKEVNRISSVYGRNNMTNFLQTQIEQGNLIAANKEKANKMLHSAGLQLPLENTFISFDNSIAYTDKNVNTQNQKNLENRVTVTPPSKNSQSVNITCFRKCDKSINANVIHKGKSEWSEVRSNGSRLYVELSNGGGIHKLTQTESERFARFYEDNENITGSSLSKSKTSNENKNLGKKGLKC